MQQNMSPYPPILFRKEVVSHGQTCAFGPVLMTLPLSYEWGAWLSTIFLGLVLILFMFAHFQEKISVEGHIDLRPGLLDVFPKAAGIVTNTFVHIGQKVKPGAVLFEIKSNFDGFQEWESENIAALVSTRTQLEKTLHKEQLQLIEYKKLLQKHYLSQYEYMVHETRLGRLHAELSQLTTHILQAKLAQSYQVTAPVEGVVHDINVHRGQYVQGSQPLLQIYPHQSTWIAYLNVPMSALRFITLSKSVKLKYDAYPSSQYGEVEGAIVRHSPILKKRSSALYNASNAYYQVEIKLPQPYLFWKKKRLPLLPGMTFQTILSGREQSLWQWLRAFR